MPKENGFSVGQVVYSKCGRDKRRPFIVTAVEDEYLYLTDGELRKVEKPKKKKRMHVQATNDVIEEIAQKLGCQCMLLDSDFRKVLVKYKL